jgi:hypothetical protein
VQRLVQIADKVTQESEGEHAPFTLAVAFTAGERDVPSIPLDAEERPVEGRAVPLEI